MHLLSRKGGNLRELLQVGLASYFFRVDGGLASGPGAGVGDVADARLRAVGYIPDTRAWTRGQAAIDAEEIRRQAYLEKLA